MVRHEASYGCVRLIMCQLTKLNGEGGILEKYFPPKYQDDIIHIMDFLAPQLACTTTIKLRNAQNIGPIWVGLPSWSSLSTALPLSTCESRAEEDVGGLEWTLVNWGSEEYVDELVWRRPSGLEYMQVCWERGEWFKTYGLQPILLSFREVALFWDPPEKQKRVWCFEQHFSHMRWPGSLEPRLSIPDFVSQLWDFKTKSRTESLGSRLVARGHTTTHICFGHISFLAT